LQLQKEDEKNRVEIKRLGRDLEEIRKRMAD
jgi:hypothetical protein